MSTHDEQPLSDLAVLPAVWRFLRAEAQEDCRETVEQHPELLSDDAHSLIKQLACAARQSGEVETAHTFGQHQELLLRCADVGIESAFAELRQRENRIQIAAPFLQATSPAESRRLLQEHPEMLDEWMFRLVEEFIQVAGLEGQARTVEILARDERLLRSCRESGIQPAFAATSKERAVSPWASPPPSEIADQVLVQMTRALSDEFTAAAVVRAARQARSVAAVIEAPTWREAGRLAGKHPEVLDESVDAALGQLASTAGKAGDPDAATLLDTHRQFLIRYGQVGKRAVKEFRRRAPGVPPEAGTDGVESDSRADHETFSLPAAFAERYNAAVKAEQCAPAGGPSGLRAAVRAWSAIVDDPDFPAAPHQFQLVVFSCAATAFERQHALTEESGALDGAIRCRKAAVDLAPEDFLGRKGWLALLGSHLLQRYEHAGRNLGDLNEAIRAQDEVMVGGAPREEIDPDDLSRFGHVRVARFHHLGDVVDLDEAVDLYEEAVTRARAEGRKAPEYQANMANALLAWAECTGELTYLDKAVDNARAAVAAAGREDPHRHQYLATLASILSRRFTWLGRLADLDEAIDYDRQALDAVPASEPGPAQILRDLAASLRSLGGADDLADALSPGEIPVEQADVHPELPGLLSHLGSDLAARFRRSRNPADLDEAIAKHREAVEATPAGDPDRLRCLTNLGTALATRARDINDLNEAVDVLRAAVEATLVPGGHLMRPGTLSNLAIALTQRYWHTRDPADLDQAIDIARDSVSQSTDTISPDRAKYLLALGHALRARYELGENHNSSPDREEALRSWQEAAEIAAAPASTRTTAARSSADALAASGDYEHALPWFTRAVELLPLVAWRGIDRTTQEHQLAEWTDLASAAAACAVDAGHPTTAVRLLEQGRSILWSQLLETRSDLAELSIAAPTLARRLMSIRADLDSEPDLPDPGMAGKQPSAVRPAEDLRIARAVEWDALVHQVRQMPEFDSFLHPPAAADLYRAAGEGTIVVVNVSQRRCDAIAVDRGGAHLIELPDLTIDAAVAHANGYLRAIHRYEFAQGQFFLTHPIESGDSPAAFRRYTTATRELKAERTAMEQTLTETLEWSWDVIAEPVLTGLGFNAAPDEGKDPPRLWWCPTGPLAVLPLHAAGYHTPNSAESSGRTVLDRTVSSYTPTLRALLQARTGPRTGADSPPWGAERMLVVAMPHTPGQTPLPNVARERDLLAGDLFRKNPSTVLEGPEATRAAVHDALHGHRWVHFSCHGKQDLTEPSSGGLYLQDGLLSLTSISASGYQGEFAFLSACKTAIGGVDLPDEAITLAAALHYTGYRHVIATLWSVYDPAAAEVTEYLYNQLIVGGGFAPDRAAQALHHAIRRLRDHYPTTPSVWIPFTHTGP